MLDYSAQGVPAEFGCKDRGSCRFGLPLPYTFKPWPSGDQYEEVRDFLVAHGSDMVGGELPHLSTTHELSSWSAHDSPTLLVRAHSGEIVAHVSAGTWMTMRGRIGQWELLIVRSDHRRVGIASAMLHKLHAMLVEQQCRELTTVRPVRSEPARALLQRIGYHVHGSDPHMRALLKPLFIDTPAPVATR